MQTPREEALAQKTRKGKTANEKRPIDPSRPLTDGERVYDTLAPTEMLPYRPEDQDDVRGGLNAAISSTASFAPVARGRRSPS